MNEHARKDHQDFNLNQSLTKFSSAFANEFSVGSPVTVFTPWKLSFFGHCENNWYSHELTRGIITKPVTMIRLFYHWTVWNTWIDFFAERGFHNHYESKVFIWPWTIFIKTNPFLELIWVSWLITGPTQRSFLKSTLYLAMLKSLHSVVNSSTEEDSFNSIFSPEYKMNEWFLDRMKRFYDFYLP